MPRPWQLHCPKRPQGWNIDPVFVAPWSFRQIWYFDHESIQFVDLFEGFDDFFGYFGYFGYFGFGAFRDRFGFTLAFLVVVLAFLLAVIRFRVGADPWRGP